MSPRPARILALGALLTAALALAACSSSSSGGGGGDGNTGGTLYVVSGTLTGLEGTLVIHYVAGEDSGDVSISEGDVPEGGGTVSIVADVASGTAYEITIGTQPTLSTCEVSGGSGTVGSEDVTSVSVTCVDDVGPGAPTGLAAVVDLAAPAVTLSWANPTEADFRGLRILRRDDGTTPTGPEDGSATVIHDEESAITTFVDTTALGGMDYQYAVYAFDDASGPNFSSAASTDAMLDAVVKKLTMGSGFTCALVNDGRVKCWGTNGAGQLGIDNTTTVGDNDMSGVPVAEANFVNLGNNRLAKDIDSGASHTCVILMDGQVKCWGQGYNGELGTNSLNSVGVSPIDDVASANLVKLGANGTGSAYTAVRLSLGNDYSCAILNDGTVKCWGYSSAGQLGQGDTIVADNNYIGDDEDVDAIPSLNLGANVVALHAGGAHVCALLESGAVRCWGDNFYEQLGTNNGSSAGQNNALNAPNVAIPGNVVAIGGGGKTTCVAWANGAAACWGDADSGALGTDAAVSLGTNAGDLNNIGVVDLNGSVVRLASGSGGWEDPIHNCALMDDGSVKCWGANYNGQLGQADDQVFYGGGNSLAMMGDLEFINLGTNTTARQITTGYFNTCALTDAFDVKCWGNGGFNGDGTQTTLGAGANDMGDNLLPVNLGL